MCIKWVKNREDKNKGCDKLFSTQKCRSPTCIIVHNYITQTKIVTASDCYYQVVVFLGANVLGIEPAEKAWRVPTGFIPDWIKVTGVSTLSRKCLEEKEKHVHENSLTEMLKTTPTQQIGKQHNPSHLKQSNWLPQVGFKPTTLSHTFFKIPQCHWCLACTSAKLECVFFWPSVSWSYTVSYFFHRLWECVHLQRAGWLWQYLINVYYQFI